MDFDFISDSDLDDSIRFYFASLDSKKEESPFAYTVDELVNHIHRTHQKISRERIIDRLDHIEKEGNTDISKEIFELEMDVTDRFKENLEKAHSIKLRNPQAERIVGAVLISFAMYAAFLYATPSTSAYSLLVHELTIFGIILWVIGIVFSSRWIGYCVFKFVDWIKRLGNKIKNIKNSSKAFGATIGAVFMIFLILVLATLFQRPFDFDLVVPLLGGATLGVALGGLILPAMFGSKK
ncbi:MAG: hypothetical protein WC408_04975 [Candidatus Micrarchaeia archaeon]|jgi:hypothetical protein